MFLRTFIMQFSMNRILRCDMESFMLPIPICIPCIFFSPAMRQPVNTELSREKRIFLFCILSLSVLSLIVKY